VKREAALTLITARLAESGIEHPRREARYLLAAAARTTTTALLALDEIDEAIFTPLLARRCAHEPLAYIGGAKEFWGLTFAVSPATLIPRPDSETLLEAAIGTFPEKTEVRTILDLGTGTGCLLLAALTEFPAAFGIGADISPAAAALAAANAKSLGLFHRAAFLAANWAAPLAQTFDLVLSNPPYIPTQDLAALMPDVAKYEPASALDGGANGTTAYQAIIAALPALLAPRGAAIIELGINQAEQVAALAHAAGFTTKTRADLAGIPRALIIRP
jgi:release factor glutamine methyltransferase